MCAPARAQLQAVRDFMRHTTPIGVPPQAPQEEAEPEEELDVTEEEEEEEEEDDEDIDGEADEEDEEIAEGAIQPCASGCSVMYPWQTTYAHSSTAICRPLQPLLEPP